MSAIFKRLFFFSVETVKRVILWLLLIGVGVLTPNAVEARTADCGRPDPNKFDEVFQCMVSLQHGNQSKVFERSAITDCRSAVVNYSYALQRSGIAKNEIPAFVPSCAMLAKGIEQIRGISQEWAKCTNYPRQFDAAHMKACLAEFVPKHYRDKQRLERLGGCADATREYETALKAGTPDRKLPEKYEKPDCAAVASVIGNKGQECLDYSPGTEHLQKCLGVASNRFTQCPALRNAYEQKLRQAYGGDLPPGYSPMTCDETAPVTAAAKEHVEQRKVEVKKEQQQARAQIAQIRNANASKSTWEWVSTGFIGPVISKAFIVHFAIIFMSISYARRQAINGKDLRIPLTFMGCFDRQTHQVRGFAMMIVALWGIWQTSMQWLVGMVLAWIVGTIITISMFKRGMFSSVPAEYVEAFFPDGKKIKPHIPDVPTEDRGRKKGGW